MSWWKPTDQAVGQAAVDMLLERLVGLPAR
jgi:hypothetical protein